MADSAERPAAGPDDALRRLFDEVPSGLLQVDEAGVVVRVNAAARALLGEVSGRSLGSAWVELEQARTRLAHLQAVTELGLLDLSLDDLLGGLLQRVRELLGADRAAILLLEEQGRRLTVRATIGVDEDVALTLQFPSGDDLIDLVRRDPRHSATGARVRVLAATPARAYMRSGKGYFVGIPLYAGGRLTGILQVGSDTDQALGDDQLALLELIAERAAVAIERASLHDRDHRTAETLQRSLLPERLPVTPGLATAARYLPGTDEAEVGGDWYDVLVVGPGRVCIAIGDVVGKGLRAASEMGQLRNAFRAFALEGFGPGAILDRLSRLARMTEAGEFSTAACLVLDPGTGRVVLASAGHLAPLVIHADGTAEFLEGGRSLPLGVPFERPAARAAYRLEPGARLVLYTDGLVERRGHGIDEGMAQLAAVAAAGPLESEPLIDHILAALVDDAHRDDDIGLVVVRLLPAALEPLRLRLPAEAMSLALLRAELRHWLEAAGLGGSELNEVLIATHEAAANAVEHPTDARERVVEVTASHDDETLEILVRDSGQWRPPQPRLERGLGLSIARKLMTSVDIEPSAEGTSVRLRRPLAVAV